MKTRTFYLVAIAVLVLVAASVICAVGRPGGLGGGNTEVEDCDAEDRRTGDPDCGPNVLRTTKKPAPKSSPRKTVRR